MNNRARLPCQKVPHHAHRHFLCGALEISHFLGNNRNLLFKKEIFYGKSSAHTRSTSILLYAEVYRYTFETLQEIPRYRQWFCQKIWDRKHMKSTDRENFPLYCCHFHATNPLSKSKKTAPQKVVIPRKAFPDKNKESLCMMPLKSRCHAWYQYTSCSKAICVYLWVHTQMCVSDIKHSGIGNQFWYVSTRNLQCTNRQSKPDSFPLSFRGIKTITVTNICH